MCVWAETVLNEEAAEPFSPLSKNTPLFRVNARGREGGRKASSGSLSITGLLLLVLLVPLSLSVFAWIPGKRRGLGS